MPGLRSPTSDLSLTVALAVLVFLSVHWFGISIDGLTGYLRHYLAPNPILLPFHVLGEITRTLALAVRLFGNMMSLEMAALLVLLVAGLLAPVPLLMLHIVEALVQAYIFGMLALVYVAGTLQSRELAEEEQPMNDMTWFTLLSTVGAPCGDRPRRDISGARHGARHHPGAGRAGAPARGREIHHAHAVHRPGDDRVARDLRAGGGADRAVPQSIAAIPFEIGARWTSTGQPLRWRR